MLMRHKIQSGGSQTHPHIRITWMEKSRYSSFYPRPLKS